MDGNWNIGCKASEVFSQLEFRRKSHVCMYTQGTKSIANSSEWATCMRLICLSRNSQDMGLEILIQVQTLLTDRELNNCFFVFVFK